MFAASNAPAGGGLFGSSGPQAIPGPDLEDVQTESLGFQALDGDAKIRLIPSPWPSNALPKPTSSLLSIASHAGLLAAAGPNVLVVAKTESVRQAFSGQAAAENNVKPFSPELQVQVPRVSQVAFSSDEKFLVICADEGGGLAMYEVQSLLQGNTTPAFQMGTEGIGIRALVPNPAEETAHIFALVLEDGKLMMANLKDRSWLQGNSGPVLRSAGVTCGSWSLRGKQLTAGLEDGTAVQLKPDGRVASTVPKPPQLKDPNSHVSSILWLKNDAWLATFNPTSFDSNSVPDSEYFLISREPKTEKYAFQRLSDPAPPFGLNRSPPYHFMVRLRKFEPHLEDAIVLSSTVCGDIGLITCSTTPLAGDSVAVNAANKYATTLMGNDARRASMPVNLDMMDSSPDTSPVGMCFDLSSRELVKHPIPTEEALENSQSPVPALMILNNEGVLSSWWFIYNDSIKQNVPYHGLAAAPRQPPASMPAVSNPISNQPVFGSSSFGATANPISAANPTLTSGSAFGSSTLPGPNMSVWGANPNNMRTGGAAFGQSSFGSGGLPGSVKPLGNTAPTGSTSGIFGQNSGNKQNQGVSTFATLGASSAANKTSFADLAKKPEDSLLGKTNGAEGPNGSIFGSSNNNSLLSGQTTSSFSTLGKDQNAFRTPATNASNAPAMTSQPSFGSTVTLPSSTLGSMGAPSALGSNQSPWGTPSLSNKTSDQSAKQGAQVNQDGDQDMNMDKPEGLFNSDLAGLQIGDRQQDSSSKAMPDKRKEEEKPINEARTESSKPEEKQQEKPVKLEQVEEAPLPPDPTTSLVKRATEEAPLPPDPTNSANEPLPEPAPLPPSPKVKSEPVEEPAPLPPLPNLGHKESEDSGPSPAGTPPVDLGEVGSSSVTPANSVGSEESQTQDGTRLSKPQDTAQRTQSAQVAPQQEWSFESISAQTPMKDTAPHEPFSSPLGSLKADESLTETPVGSIKPPYYFPAGGQTQESPRSPSPVRTETQHGSLRRSSPRRSSTSPNRRIVTSPQRIVPQSNPFEQTPLRPPARNQTSQTETPKTPKGLPPVRESHSPPSPAQQDPSKTDEDMFAAALEEDGSAQMARDISAPIYPMERLPEFVAHKDYVMDVPGHGIPSHIERLYRDINSMLDTLGINAHNLASFMKYHTENYRDGGREREHLEDHEDHEDQGWVLVEVQDLGVVLKGIQDRLDAERLQEPGPKIVEAREMWRELIRLRTKTGDITKAVDDRNGIDGDSRSSPSRSKLSAEQSDILKKLREQFAKVQQQLAKAEDATTELRAKLAAQGLRNGEEGAASPRRVPTVEAVINTIAKMTRMAEQKRSDLDLLEARMRKLKMMRRESPSLVGSVLGSSRSAGSTGNEDDFGLGKLSLNGRRSVSPAFATPPSSKAKRSSMIEASTRNARTSVSPSYSVPESTSSDEGEEEETVIESIETPSHRSLRTPMTKAQAKIERYLPKPSAEKVEEYLETRAQRRRVMGLLRKKLIERDEEADQQLKDTQD